MSALNTKKLCLPEADRELGVQPAWGLTEMPLFHTTDRHDSCKINYMHMHFLKSGEEDNNTI